MKGLTGLIKFDYEGFRTPVELQIIELTKNGTKEKGIWNSSQEEMLTFHDDEFLQAENENFKNRTFKVIIPLVRIVLNS
jgi:hypothetical protein